MYAVLLAECKRRRQLHGNGTRAAQCLTLVWNTTLHQRNARISIEHSTMFVCPKPNRAKRAPAIVLVGMPAVIVDHL